VRQLPWCTSTSLSDSPSPRAVSSGAVHLRN
jgi:hypothetical protein